ncbi:DUF4112 domain-containing protein [Marinivivus vitaminiproducens]|uniref:DUF4112 domain-containing protein n=1 Tax=Marinivivus vitaminiproducens TaxID=3035935 RepID=UPI0027A3B87A|nr:DUF4112 domain-containing protein [Geminicoccaceae bacterium SCSIO 64248]
MAQNATQTHDDLKDLEWLAQLLDARWRLPGTEIRFGLDPIVGLIPGVGDAVMGAVGAYIIVEAHRRGVPKSVLLRMIANVGIDTVAGSVPIVGSIFDVGFRSHKKNFDLLRAHVASRPKRPQATSAFASV